MFNHQEYLQRFLTEYKAGRFYNDSEARVERASTPCFRLIGVHHLSGYENRGKHNLYMDVVDTAGKRVNERIQWGWVGQRANEVANPVVLDKPLNEPSGNISIGAGQVIWARVLGKSSDTVYNVATLLPDEDGWNTLGHHSHYAVWMWVDDIPEVPPEEPSLDKVIALLEQALKELRK